MTDDGKEPGGWELLRAITGIREDLQSIKSGYVSIEAFNSLKEDVKEMKENGKFRIGAWLSVVGIVLSCATAIWAILKG